MVEEKDGDVLEGGDDGVVVDDDEMVVMKMMKVVDQAGWEGVG